MSIVASLHIFSECGLCKFSLHAGSTVLPRAQELLHWFSSRREQEKSWLSLRVFGCRSHSRLGLCAHVFHTSFKGMCMSPCQLWPCVLFAVVCVCVFLCPRWEFSLSSVLGLWIVAIIHCEVVAVDLPWFWVASWMLRLWTSFGCCVELFWPR